MYLSHLNQSLVKRNYQDANLLTPVGVKNAGIPAPPARILSAIVPCGHNSIAISPERYFFSRNLLLPRKERINLSIWPDATRGERPPPPAAPALFDTAVRFLREERPRRSMAAMIVSGQIESIGVYWEGLQLGKGLTCCTTEPKTSTQYRRTTLQICYCLIRILVYFRSPSHNLRCTVSFCFRVGLLLFISNCRCLKLPEALKSRYEM